MRTILLLMIAAISLLMTSSVRSQPSGCSAFSTEVFDIYDETGRLEWETPDMECVEYFDVTVSTPHGVRHIRGIGDINVDALLPSGGIAAIESGARASAARFADLGDYKISDVVILITGVDADPDDLVDAERGIWKHSSALADASGRRTSTEGICPIRMFTINDMTASEMEQAVAHELFHCVQFGSLRTDQNRAGVPWWVEGSAMMFTNHVFPDLAPVMRRERRFHRSIEEQVPIHRMAYEALYPFLFYDEQVGISGLLPLLRSMPASTSDSAQIAALNAMLSPEQWLDFAKAVEDRKIRYRNGEMVDFGDPVDGETWSITTTATHRRTLKPFVIMPGWADYECGLWDNRLTPRTANIAIKATDDPNWQAWPAETDCRDKGSERYRIIALSTQRSNVALSLRAERRIACERCLTGETVIDACMVGTWQQTGGGPLEWLSRMPGVPPISAPNMGQLRVSMRDDGTFTSQPVAINYDMTIPDEDGARHNTNRGQIAASAGRWSAQRGELRACFDSGGQSSTTATVTYPDGLTGSGNIFGAGYGGTGGSVRYSCSGDSMETRVRMPRGGDMVYRFTRVSVRR